MDKLEVLLVDASILSRKNMTELVNLTRYGNVLRNASNAQIAMEWLNQLRLDVVLLDINVLKENGSGFVRTLRENHPNVEIIIVSDTETKSAEMTLEAINDGAIDFVLAMETENGIPVESSRYKLKQSLESIFTQIKVDQFLKKPHSRQEQATTSHKTESTVPHRAADLANARPKPFLSEIDLVVIASSTGGPAALEVVIGSLPADYKKPTLLVQHMPPDFTRVLAETLCKKYNKNVREGQPGDLIRENEIVIAPGGKHMVVEEGTGNMPCVGILDTPFYNGLKPAADILLKSVATVYKNRRILCVVLTGMGNDGTEGIRELKQNCQVYSLTQSEESCVVYGMPKCVAEAGLSDEVVDLKDMAYRMYQLSYRRGD